MLDAYAVLGVSPDVTQDELKAAHRALVRRHHPDLAPPQQRAAATRRVQEINVAYGLVRDPARRAAYDRARRGGTDTQALVTAAGRWAGRWWRRNRSLLRRRAARVAASASTTRHAGRRAAAEATGRALWLLLCALGTAGGWLAAVTAQRLAGVDGWVTPVVGTLGGLAVGNRRGWYRRLRLARVPLDRPGGWADLVLLAVVVATALWVDARL